MSWFIHILVNSLVLIVVAGYFDSFYIENVGTAILASGILSVLNMFVKPFLLFLTLPITFLTLGLFIFIINAVTLMIAEGLMGDAFQIDSFGTAILAAIVISILNTLIQNLVIKPLREKKKS